MKELLIKQKLDTFERDPEMSLLSSLQGLTQPEAEWRFNATTWTIEEILYHVASCKLDYCQQGFARWHEPTRLGAVVSQDDLLLISISNNGRLLKFSATSNNREPFSRKAKISD